MKILKIKKFILVTIAILAGYYLLTWVISNMVWYEIDSEYTYQHQPIELSGVDIAIWTNPTVTTCRRSLLCPMLIRCYSKSPYVVILRATDNDHKASRLRIHSAVVRLARQSAIPLSFIDTPQKETNIWYSFHENASEWIVHNYHDEKLKINGQFSIEIDLSLEKKGDIIKKTLSIILSPTVKVRKGWVFLSA